MGHYVVGYFVLRPFCGFFTFVIFFGGAMFKVFFLPRKAFWYGGLCVRGTFRERDVSNVGQFEEGCLVSLCLLYRSINTIGLLFIVLSAALAKIYRSYNQ